MTFAQQYHDAMVKLASQVPDCFWEFNEKYLTADKEYVFLENFNTFAAPFIAVGLYLLMLDQMPKRMTRGYHFKWVVATWNLLLSLISICMFFGCAFPWFFLMSKHGVITVMCDTKQLMTDHELAPGFMFWCWVFCLTKYIELGDTFFLLLKNPKREVQFLHWYHHVTVLLFTWFASLWKFSVGTIFILMNSAVHTCMYYYYFQTELGYRPSWAKALTIFQISQMAVGIGAIVVWVNYWRQDIGCRCDRPGLLIGCGVVMYSSYFHLFVKFFYQRYVKSGNKKSAKKNGSAAAPEIRSPVTRSQAKSKKTQ